jgi:SET domain-containing protein
MRKGILIFEMANGLRSYVSPKLEMRYSPAKNGYGLFATQTLFPDEVVVVWNGDIMTAEELAQQPEAVRTHALQVEEQLYQVSNPSLEELEPGDMVNHSCEPNTGFFGQIVLVAMRLIAPGEEICFDYAMSDGSPYDEFDCQCGTPSCRGRITGEDWRLPALQRRYAGYFSPYLQRRMSQAAVLPSNGAAPVPAC